MADLSALDNNAGISYQRVSRIINVDISHQQVPRLINVYFLSQNCRSKHKNCITMIFFFTSVLRMKTISGEFTDSVRTDTKQLYAKPFSRPSWDFGGEKGENQMNQPG